MLEAAPLLPGDPREAPGYRLEGRLGEGAQGVVFLGRDPAGGHVAVNVLHDRLAGDAEARRRFRAETAAAKHVAGFGTARGLDADASGERPYVTSEYVDGPRCGKRRWTAAAPAYGETWGPAESVVLATGKSSGEGIWALDARTGDTLWSVPDIPKPGVLAWNGTTVVLVAGGDDNHDNQTLYALRLAPRPEGFTGSHRRARHPGALAHHPGTSTTRAVLRLAMHRTGHRELPAHPSRHSTGPLRPGGGGPGPRTSTKC